MLHFLRDHGSSLPFYVMLLFVGIGVAVLLYVLTDRRRRHLTRMESMPLDDGVPVPPAPSTSPRSEAGHG
jgi:hypothetical protein